MDQEKLQQDFLEAYEEYADAIYKHLYYRCYSKELAQDLMQETFTKVWKYLSEGKQVDNLRAFLYRVAKNLLIDHIRKKKETSLDQLLEGGFQPSETNTERIHTNLEYQEVVQKVHKLPEKYRDIVLMRYVEELSISEISENIGKTDNVVSVRLNRAIKKLRNIV